MNGGSSTRARCAESGHVSTTHAQCALQAVYSIHALTLRDGHKSPLNGVNYRNDLYTTTNCLSIHRDPGVPEHILRFHHINTCYRMYLYYFFIPLINCVIFFKTQKPRCF